MVGPSLGSRKLSAAVPTGNHWLKRHLKGQNSALKHQQYFWMRWHPKWRKINRLEAEEKVYEFPTTQGREEEKWGSARCQLPCFHWECLSIQLGKQFLDCNSISLNANRTIHFCFFHFLRKQQKMSHKSSLKLGHLRRVQSKQSTR